jgi:hypothetical protein
MTPRSIRRAAERKAKKIASREARLVANRVNAMDEPALLSEAKTQKTPSTGPTSAEGKAVSSQNALKTGLTGKTVLLPTDDPATFEKHVAAYFAEYQPEGLRECEIVQSLAETRWRLNRIFSLETAIFAQPPQDDQPAPTQLEIYLKCEKQLRNLHIQEGRLHRRYEKELAELLQLQKDRYLAEASLAADGFDFSTSVPPSAPRQLTRPETAGAGPLNDLSLQASSEIRANLVSATDVSDRFGSSAS